MPRKYMRIFLDANIFVAAVGCPEGGSAFLFQVAEKEKWTLVTNEYIIEESRRNINAKLFTAKDRFITCLANKSLLVLKDPSSKFCGICASVVPQKDAPVLAGAILSKSDILCTLDRKDFHNKQIKNFAKRFGVQIMTPKEILLAYRDNRL